MSGSGNKYESMARKHWQQWRPNALAEMRDPDDFFLKLGREADERIDQLQQHILAASQRPDGQLETAAWWTAARHEAENQVIREMILVEPEPDPESEAAEAAEEAAWLAQFETPEEMAARREAEAAERRAEYLEELRIEDPEEYRLTIEAEAAALRDRERRRIEHPEQFQPLAE